MTKDEIITAIAEVLAGLQVPVSLNMPIGAAREPWGKLHEETKSFGWALISDYETMLRSRLDIAPGMDSDWPALARDMLASDDAALRERFRVSMKEMGFTDEQIAEGSK